MFIFHTLVFALCIILADSCFFPRNDTSQKDISFLLTVNQKVLEVIQAFKLELFCEVLGTHLAQTLQKPSPFWMILWVQPLHP